MRFRLIDAAKKEFPVQRLCKVLGVSQSGYFAWKDRPPCRRQNEDMVLLAHIRSAFGECQEFRVRAGIMGTKEISHGPTQRACDS